ncbi:unnamed protein product (macronuclear) [Paramecium tetraurelia]|uniref:Uncharacterized protein n=1 Tax=Paramecium tetraurelia TaxID=5888 RepID=A0D0V9_PARTE|nr:uncharacterized protein GSPATT00012228001 [Paramecium tetraurelia]CAK76676.1 unnamed protein product [Paramecium tetraurelia]|eukprot:XP_001444073.1 hypothetical protein (macronuclear) [Paramecium tetraurelia strain d4-2]
MKTRNSQRQSQREDLSVTCQEVLTIISQKSHTLYINYFQALFQNVSMSDFPLYSSAQTPRKKRGPISKKHKYTTINLKKHKSSKQFICYEDRDLNIPEKYQSMLQKHKSDDDRESDSEQIKHAINYLYKDLLQCIEREKN